MVMIKSFVCENRQLKEINFDKIRKSIKTKKPTWLDVENPNKEELSFLLKEFKFHPLTLEDSINDQMTKIDDYENYCFAIIHILDPSMTFTTQLSFFLSEKYLVTIHEKPLTAINAIEDRCKKNTAILSRGTDFLAYSILDAVVDEFFPLIDKLEENIDDLEEKIVGFPSREILNQIIELKRKLFTVRKLVWPLRDILSIISRGDFKYVKPEHTVYFKDVYDHVVRIIDIVDVGRDMVATGMEAYLSTISNYLNVVMKKLTAITAILMFPALIAGIYGMNFQDMPELNAPYGYYVVLGFMILFGVIMYIYFHKKDWI
jgi:magnesium transporter